MPNIQIALLAGFWSEFSVLHDAQRHVEMKMPFLSNDTITSQTHFTTNIKTMRCADQRSVDAL
jgi:hypothetical protein